jgi:hypothetical protein
LSCPLLCSRCDPRRPRFSWFHQLPTAGAPCEAFFSRRARRVAVSWSLCLKRRCGSWCAQTSRSVLCIAGHTQYLRLVSVSRPPAHRLMILSDLAASVFFRQHSSESTSRFPLRFRTPVVLGPVLRFNNHRRFSFGLVLRWYCSDYHRFSLVSIRLFESLECTAVGVTPVFVHRAAGLVSPRFSHLAQRAGRHRVLICVLRSSRRFFIAQSMLSNGY